MFAPRMDRVTPSAIMELIKTAAAGDYISFASGLPDPALFPVDRVREITDEVLARDGRLALQYGPAEGYPPLRELVAGLLRERGLPAGPENVLITNGSQQGLDLAARAFLSPGDGVALENPSYLAAVQAFDSAEARYHPLAQDDEGPSPDDLQRALAAGARLVYLLPNFQNPTGLTTSARRREELARAIGSRAVLLEDDAYHDLRYDGEPLPPLCALVDSPWALYLGTFSKTIAPGLRIGYVYGAPPVIERLAQLKQIADLHSGSLTQRVVFEYCQRGYLQPGIERFCTAYRARRDALLNALETHLSGHATWTRPAGGMFVWVTLPEGQDAEALLRRAMEHGVVFVPGASFFPNRDTGRNTLRLTFVSVGEADMEEGVRRLAAALGDL
jgi:2-aminoadipate transaminase